MKNIANFSFILLWVNILQLRFLDVEPFIATAELENVLLINEKILLDFLERYISRNEKLAEFRARLDHHIQEHEHAIQNPQEYIAYPTNAFLLIRRLNSWLNVTNILFQEGFVVDTNAEEIVKLLPSGEDVQDAALGLLRLQDLYDFSAESLAKGELDGTRCCSQMTSDDCYEIGIVAFDNDRFNYSIVWMREALRKKDADVLYTTSEKTKISEYLAISEEKQENIRQQTSNSTDENELKTLDDENKGFQEELKEIFKNQIQKSSKKVVQNEEYETCKMQCRGKMKSSSWQSSSFKCRYAHKNKPYLLMGPLKEEDIVLDPPVSLYHEVMYPNEIRELKAMATKQLERGKVQPPGNNGTRVSLVRTTKIAWLREDEYPIVNNILRRVRLWTSLSTEYKDSLQLANYGIGGHYNLHYDFFADNATTITKGDRISTILFYMSNVTQGGATVFPRLNVTVWPEEGSAISWYNLHSSGVPDYRTLHAACPVLQGSKWVANLWIYEKGQELLRLCDPLDAPEMTETVSEMI